MKWSILAFISIIAAVLIGVFQPITQAAVCTSASFLNWPDGYFSDNWKDSSGTAQEWANRIWAESGARDSLQDIEVRAVVGPVGTNVVAIVITPKEGTDAIADSREVIRMAIGTISQAELGVSGVDTLEITSGDCDLISYGSVQIDPAGQPVSVQTCRLTAPPYSTLIGITRGDVFPTTTNTEGVYVLGLMLQAAANSGCQLEDFVATPASSPEASPSDLAATPILHD